MKEGQTKEALKSRQRCPLSPLLLRIVLKFSAIAIRPEKEIKCLMITEEEVNTCKYNDLLRIVLAETEEERALITHSHPPSVHGYP